MIISRAGQGDFCPQITFADVLHESICLKIHGVQKRKTNMGYDAISMHWLGVSTNVGTQGGGRANSGFQVSQW